MCMCTLHTFCITTCVSLAGNCVYYFSPLWDCICFYLPSSCVHSKGCSVSVVSSNTISTVILTEFTLYCT